MTLAWRRLGQSPWLFAGPGSPTYALDQWRDTPIPETITNRLREGGAVVFASAAALTLGSHTIPVYEIYKAGIAPDWVPGLDVIRAATGLPAVIIPHYDNAEGGHHDTRFCYLGERRLSMMESRLPEGSFILGVDEHTAVVLDLDARTVSVLGNGTMTIRRQGRGVVHESGAIVGFDELTYAGDGERVFTAYVDAPPAQTHVESSLTADTRAAVAAFNKALAADDVDGCVNSILALEQALVDWAADTEESDDREAARAELRSMVVRLGDLAQSSRSGNDDGLIDLIVTERSMARGSGDFEASDRIRAALTDLGIEVRDTPDGATWQRADSARTPPG